MEKLKHITGSDGRYFISSTGKVYSMINRGRYNTFRKTPKELKPVIINSGYAAVFIMINGKKVLRLVHRLVAQAFLQNPDCLPEVNHKNEDKLDNRVENLEWCTHKYNQNYNTTPKRISETNKNSALIRWFLNPEKLMREITKNANGYEFNEEDYREDGSKKTWGYKISQVDSIGNTIRVFNGLSEAAKELNLSTARISQICNKKSTKRSRIILVREEKIYY